ncbi:hypothetical protein RGAI101_1643 [Roseobacter sp. GAI101]|nr:hypothetical protein RGAI101_1643 [Roseobacter sp. GAI101]
MKTSARAIASTYLDGIRPKSPDTLPLFGNCICEKNDVTD